MSPLPSHMRDRWLNRTEPGARAGTIYWHVLMRTYPGAQKAALNAQRILSGFPGFHMTPHEWLHMTTLTVGSTEEVSRQQMIQMLEGAQQILSHVEPIPVKLGKILYHPEAVMLAVHPAGALKPILNAAQKVTLTVTGRPGLIDGSHEWTPHMTVSYSTASQSADPIIAALGKTVGEYHVVVDALTLVVQWGAERLWDWEPVGTATLGSPRPSCRPKPA
ncbi:hypothetical protein GCM10023321_61680 [Pseudonocardia eucalypti]|uniref:2'-5' RNA ligase family protein n=1 Tax=Pseudonocardia eucalypti TaxID=648755 RepID=A0ABP9QVS7_9PSEU